MSAAGIGGVAFAAGIGIHTFRLACNWIRERLESDPKLEDVELIVSWGTSNDDRLLYESVRSNLADGLLLPWRFPQSNVPDDVKRRLEEFFDAAYGDPRLCNRQNLAEQRNLWVGVSDGALQVRMQWLPREALEHFLKVVDATAEQQHQWEYRRAFWGAYIDRNHVHDAWVAFGHSSALAKAALIKYLRK